MKVLLVAPPRLLWPYMNEQDNFLLPQGLASLAAVLRQDGADVTVIDCPPQRVGWRTLEERVRTMRPDVLCRCEWPGNVRELENAVPVLATGGWPVGYSGHSGRTRVSCFRLD